MKARFRFNAMKVAEMEKTFGKGITEIASDSSVSTIATFVSKAIINEDGTIGCSMNVAYDLITDLIKNNENGIMDLQCDIIEELCEVGFLPKAMKEMRTLIQTQTKKAEEIINQAK